MTNSHAGDQIRSDMNIKLPISGEKMI
jgi:hypothetical protein